MIDKVDGTLDTEVLGFRQWTVNADLGLKSAASNCVWTPGDNHAVCMGAPSRCKQAPSKGCHCGFYALHTPSFWYGEGGTHSGGSMWNIIGGYDGYVSGLVIGWGRMEVHHDGFRAEHARIVAIACPDGPKRDVVIARAVAAEYGVPIVPQAELERIAPEFGATCPKEYRPAKPKPPKLDDIYAQYTSLYNQMLGQANRQIYGGGYASGGAGHSYSWQSYSMPMWASVPPLPEEALPKTVEEKIRDLKKPTYDPSVFLPKRKGGKR
jgi:hypothetical protein